MTQIVGSKERKKLEVYEHKVYMKLHEVLLKDEGNPDLEGHRNDLLTQINKKLTILGRIIDERKFLVPQRKDVTGMSEMSHTKSTQQIKNLSVDKHRSGSTKRAEYNDSTREVEIKEFHMPVDPEQQKEMLRAEEAERIIREMEANKGLLNYHRISEKELAEVGSIDSDNVDYAEVFNERITDLEVDLERTNKRINYVNEVISKTDKTLRELTKRSIGEVQEYVYTLHKEIEEANEKIKTSQGGSNLSEEVIKKLVRCKCKCRENATHEVKLKSGKRNYQNYSMLLSKKGSIKLTKKDFPNSHHSNANTNRVVTPETSLLISKADIQISCVPHNSKNIQIGQVDD